MEQRPVLLGTLTQTTSPTANDENIFRESAIRGPSVTLVLFKLVWQKPRDVHWHLHLVYSLKLGLGANTPYLEGFIPVLLT